MKKLILLIGIIFLISISLIAGKVDTLSIASKAMQAERKCVVVTPDSYHKNMDAYPVVYLLHGFSGNYSNWVTRVKDFSKLADKYQMILVCPDGGFAGWYLNSPIDPKSQFKTYIGEEVPAYIESNFRTIKDRKARAITGLSMGGNGGLLMGFHYPAYFGAAGSMSGAVDISYAISRYSIEKVLGELNDNKEQWNANSAIYILNKEIADSLALIIDCGSEDALFPLHKLLHEKMLVMKITHDYIERQGRHDWAYWSNAVDYQLLFFRRYFNKNYPQKD